MKERKRKSTRLKDYDYSNAGVYFVTVCVKDKKPLLWNNARPYDIAGYTAYEGVCIKANRSHYLAKIFHRPHNTQ